MSDEEDFDIEETTVEEDIENLLNKIDADLNSGKRNIGCQTLENIQGEKYKLLKSIQYLHEKYQQLKERCNF